MKVGTSVPAAMIVSDTARRVKLHQVISSPRFCFCVIPDFGRWKKKQRIGVSENEPNVRQKPSYTKALFLVKDVDVDGFGAVVILKQLDGRRYDAQGDEVVFHVKGWEYPSHVTVNGNMKSVEHYEWVLESPLMKP